MGGAQRTAPAAIAVYQFAAADQKGVPNVRLTAAAPGSAATAGMPMPINASIRTPETTVMLGNGSRA